MNLYECASGDFDEVCGPHFSAKVICEDDIVRDAARGSVFGKDFAAEGVAGELRLGRVRFALGRPGQFAVKESFLWEVALEKY